MPNSTASDIKSLSGGRMTATTSATVRVSAARMPAKKVHSRRVGAASSCRAANRLAARGWPGLIGSAFKFVPNTPHRQQEQGLRGVGLDFFAQPADVHRHRGRVSIELLPPHAVE